MKNGVRLSTATALILALAATQATIAQTMKPAHHKVSESRITNTQAIKVALKKYPGKVVGPTKLENEDGKWQFAVNIKTKRHLLEVMVDAHTGLITSVEKVTKAEERAEARAASRKRKQ